MKKSAIALAIAAVALVSQPVMARTQADSSKDSDKSKKERVDRGRRPDRPACNPFEGLNLTEQQQKSLNELKEQRRAEMKQRKAECKDKQQCTKDKKDKKDLKKGDGKKMRAEARKAYLAKVKAILTPEQYVTFLENYYANTPAPRHGGKKMDKGPRHGGKDFQRGDRPAKRGNR